MAKEQKKSIITLIKDRVSNSGRNTGAIFKIQPDSKKRIRFLADMEDAVQVTFHDKWEEVDPTPCLSYYGKLCEHCESPVEGLRTRDLFVWSVYSYEDKGVKLFMFAANRNSPVAQMLSLYDEYETITNRDFIIQRRGKQMETTYTLTPLDKSKFKGKDGALDEAKIFEILAEAYGIDTGKSTKKKAKPKDDDKDFEDEEEDDIEDEELEDEDDEDEDEDDDEDIDDEEDDEEEDEEDDEDEEEEEPAPKKVKAKAKPAAKAAKKPEPKSKKKGK